MSTQDVELSASVSSDTVALGGSFDLSIVIESGTGVDVAPTVGDLVFAVEQGRSTQSSVQMIGGGAGVAIHITYTFRYRTTQEGTFDIAPIAVSVGGQTFQTQPLVVTVSSDLPQGDSPGSDPASPPGGSGASSEVDPAAELFLTVEASKSTVYVGEPLVVEYRLWTEVSVAGLSLMDTPDPEGFWVENLSDADLVVEQRERNGRTYTTAVVRRVALIPIGSGARRLEPLGVEATVRRPGFGLFSTTRNQRIPLYADELAIEVEPLPEDAPAPFSGVVGTLALSASLDRDSVATNDALTLTVRAEGRGNMRQVELPELVLGADVEIFPPETTGSISARGTTLTGYREFEYVLVPRAPGVRTVPPLSLAYLDDATGQYRIASTEAIPLVVSGDGTETFGGDVRTSITPVREDIRYIHLENAPLRNRGANTLGGTWFWITLLGPLTVLAGAAGVDRRRARLERDASFARRRRASRMARKRLKAVRALADGDGRLFYAEADRALRELVANRLDLAQAGLRTLDIASELRAGGVSETIVEEVVEALDRCDRARFASSDHDPLGQQEFMRTLDELMASLGRELRR